MYIYELGNWVVLCLQATHIPVVVLVILNNATHFLCVIVLCRLPLIEDIVLDIDCYTLLIILFLLKGKLSNRSLCDGHCRPFIKYIFKF